MSRATPPRVLALSEQLIRVHQALRERLAALRAELATGTNSIPDVPSHMGPTAPIGNSDPDDLLGHCLSFCTAVHTHHTGEDQQVFPALREAAPELAPVIGKLEEDHVLVAGLLGQLRDLLATPPVPATLQRQLDGLTAILESHFSFEERRIAAALDTLGPHDQFPDAFRDDLHSPP